MPNFTHRVNVMRTRYKVLHSIHMALDGMRWWWWLWWLVLWTENVVWMAF